MKWPVFGNNKKPRAKTMAEKLREAAPLVKLPRPVHHAMERDRTISFEAARFSRAAAYQEIKQKGEDDLRALAAGSREEMKRLHGHLVEVRDTLKRLEMSYLFHYHRLDLAERSLAKINKIRPGTSGRKESTRDTIEKNMDLLSDEERKIAEKLLGKF